MVATAPVGEVVAATDKPASELLFRSGTMLALTASAMALPGVAGLARADAPPTRTTIAYRYSSYQEDDLAVRHRVAGDLSRYDIDVHQLRLVKPVGDDFAVTVNSSYESMGGASPWYTQRLVNDRPGVIMSGATIVERRREIIANGRYYLDNGTIAATTSVSNENDYRSLSFGVDGERHYRNNQITVAAGLSHARDKITPTDAALFGRITEARKRSSSGFVSFSFILDPVTLLQTGVSVTQLSGFLSDPYKLRDIRPDYRTQLAWSNAYRRFFVSANASMHADYRYYRDSFGIDSHTLDLAWHQNLGRNFRIVPSFRYYSQDSADFFRVVDDFSLPLSTFQSSDYRLADFGAISGGLRLVAYNRDWQLTVAGERYIADAGFALRTPHEAAPALVRYKRISVGLERQF